MTRSMTLLPCLLAVALMTACSKSADTPPAGKSTETAASGAGDDAATTVAPKRHDAKPIESYTHLDLSPSSFPDHVYADLIEKVRQAFWSAAPKQLDKMAFDYSPEYRREHDTFKRSDMLKSLTPQLEQTYASVQAHRDYAVRTSHLMEVYSYDASLGGFRVSFTSDEEKQGTGIFKSPGLQGGNDGAWNFRFIGVPSEGDKPFVYHPKNEDEAHAIESALAAHRSQGNDGVFVWAQYEGHVLGSTWEQGRSDIILLGVDAITAVDRDSQKPLLTVDGSTLGPIKISCRSTREALHLPEPKEPVATAFNAYVSPPPC